jgi:nucleotide-binding universal stress UspA family protein
MPRAIRSVGAGQSPQRQFAEDGAHRHAAERVVSEAVDGARATGWGVPVTGELTVGWPAAVLANESRTASLVVLGDRGLGGFTGLLVGSVAVQVAAHAVCPVLVARGTAHRGDVLLGVDRSEANETAIGLAFEEAALRRTEADEDRALTEAIAPWQDKYPDVTVHRRLVRGRVRPVLIDATRRARLVVVGSRGRGGFTGLLLGSVSQALLHHADCPVAIVPHVPAAAQARP